MVVKRPDARAAPRTTLTLHHRKCAINAGRFG
jgi:hypothetical protein